MMKEGLYYNNTTIDFLGNGIFLSYYVLIPEGGGGYSHIWAIRAAK